MWGIRQQRDERDEKAIFWINDGISINTTLKSIYLCTKRNQGVEELISR